jgi:predicted ABC-type ATPase
MLSTCELALKVEEMTSTLANQFYRLLILAGPSGAGKTAVLQEIHKRANMPYINVNLQLAQRMLDLNEKQRAINLSGEQILQAPTPL